MLQRSVSFVLLASMV